MGFAPGGPGAPPPPPPAGAAGGKRPLWIALAVLLVLALVAGGVLVWRSGRGTSAPTAVGPSEVLLQPASDTGPDPFTSGTGSYTTATATLPPSTPTASPTAPTPTASGASTAPTPGPVTPTTTVQTGISTASGSAPGLYGGTGDNSVCDRAAMTAFLADHPDKARAWTDALTTDPTLRWSGGTTVAPSQIGAYLAELTPVLLRYDTRVTNHGYVDGRFTTWQAVLQAGSAVMIDRYGVPRVRCTCGNPLTPPVPVSGTTTYVGPQWPGFTPATMTAVVASVTVINVVTVININTGELAGQPVGETTLVPAPTPSASPEPTVTSSPSPSESATTTAGPTPEPSAITPSPDPAAYCDVWTQYVVNEPKYKDFKTSEEVVSYVREAFAAMLRTAPDDVAADVRTVYAWSLSLATDQIMEDPPAEVAAAFARMQAHAEKVCGAPVG